MTIEERLARIEQHLGVGQPTVTLRKEWMPPTVSNAPGWNPERETSKGPTELPVQWKHEPHYDTWKATPGNEVYSDGPIHCVVPAQPKPENYTDSKGQEWEAMQWRDYTDTYNSFFSTDGREVLDIASVLVKDSPPFHASALYNGWRWTARKVQPKVRRWVQNATYASAGGVCDIDIPMIEVDGQHDIDSAAIARDEVVRELGRIIAEADGWGTKALDAIERRLAELREEQP